MKILVAGGTGFVGSNLIRTFRQHDFYVLTNDKKSPKSSKNVHYIYTDLSQPLKVKKIAGLDCIIHLAQGPQLFPDEKLIDFKINTLSTLELLEYGRQNKIKKFIYASSGAVYGAGLTKKKLKEGDQLNPDSFYGATKVAAETIIKPYEQFFDCIVLRFFFPYGSGTPPRQLFGKLAANLKNGKEIFIAGPGVPYINPIYIGDLMVAFQKLFQFKGSLTVNLAGEKIYSIKDIVSAMSVILGVKPVIKHIKAVSQNQSLIGDNSLAKKILNFTPETSLEDGLKNFLKGDNANL